MMEINRVNKMDDELTYTAVHLWEDAHYYLVQQKPTYCFFSIFPDVTRTVFFHKYSFKKYSPVTNGGSTHQSPKLKNLRTRLPTNSLYSVYFNA